MTKLYRIGRLSLTKNFEVILRRAALETYSATWILGTKSAFALGLSKTTVKIVELTGRRTTICLHYV
jgi:hypothetical protein